MTTLSTFERFSSLLSQIWNTTPSWDEAKSAIIFSVEDDIIFEWAEGELALMRGNSNDGYTGYVGIWEDRGRIDYAPHPKRPPQLQLQYNAFAQQWEDTLRRNCWLLDIPIVCTAHEQVEWKLWFEEQTQKESPQ